MQASQVRGTSQVTDPFVIQAASPDIKMFQITKIRRLDYSAKRRGTYPEHGQSQFSNPDKERLLGKRLVVPLPPTLSLEASDGPSGKYILRVFENLADLSVRSVGKA